MVTVEVAGGRRGESRVGMHWGRKHGDIDREAREQIKSGRHEDAV